MTSNAGCWKRRLAVLVIATSLLSGCATDSTETGTVTVCPPVVDYTSAEQARAGGEVDVLPEGAMLIQMLSDYAVMRDQARTCR